MPRLYLAAYTAPLTERRGYRWIWQHQNLPDELLGVFYSKIKKPTDFALWSSNELHGGLAFVDSEWCAVYRYLNAGRDASGRRGGLFLTAGFLRWSELSQLDLLQALESPVFSTPLDASPQRMELDLPPVPTRCPDDLLRKLRDASTVEVVGVEHVNQMAAACAQRARGSDFSLQVNGEPARMACSLSVSQSAVEERKLSPHLHTAKRPEPSPEPPVRNSHNVNWKWIILLAVLVIGGAFVFLRRYGSIPGQQPGKPESQTSESENSPRQLSKTPERLPGSWQQTPEPQQQKHQKLRASVTGAGKSQKEAESNASQVASQISSGYSIISTKAFDSGEMSICVMVIEYVQK